MTTIQNPNIYRVLVTPNPSIKTTIPVKTPNNNTSPLMYHQLNPIKHPKMNCSYSFITVEIHMNLTKFL